MKRSRLLPFWIIPASWGLSGESRDIAQAEYYYTGKDLKVKLAQIKYEGDAMHLRLLDIRREYGEIDEYTYQLDSAAIKYKNNIHEYNLAELEINHKHNKISDLEYEKKSATLQNKSWVKILSIDADGAIEFDWNDQFITELEEAGYGPFPKQEMVVDQWFNEICKNITLENFQGDLGLIEEQAGERGNNFVSVKPVGENKKEIK